MRGMPFTVFIVRWNRMTVLDPEIHVFLLKVVSSSFNMLTDYAGLLFVFL